MARPARRLASELVTHLNLARRDIAASEIVLANGQVGGGRRQKAGSA